MHRRDWLKSVLASGALLGCESFDRRIFDQDREADSRVCILGGGLAGLTAAYALLAQQKSCRVYEASGRWGGRVLSLQGFSKSLAAVDLGGEWIHQDQEELLGLVRSLRLDLWKEKSIPWFLKGAQSRIGFEKIPFSLLDPYLRRKVASMTEAEMDSLPVADLLMDIYKNFPRELGDGFMSWVQWEWGDAKLGQSSLQVLRAYQTLARPLSSGLSRHSYRIKGGARVLVQALVDRISGVLPEVRLRLQHRLVQIETVGSRLRLLFETPEGKESLVFNQVICTLPVSSLMEVPGFESLGWSKQELEVLKKAGLGQHKKAVRALAIGSDFPIGLSYNLGDQTWRWMHPGFDRERAVNRIETLQSVGDLKLYNVPGASQIVNWSQFPHIRGSRSHVNAGSFLDWQSLRKSVSQRRALIFAGEQWSAAGGSMAGAVESGFFAAQRI
ncbi:MAG: FAD-dependent oxidoreductase [Bdellovibrio sp.]